MKRITHWRGTPAHARGASLALGNFDGVHRGHQAVLAAARAGASDAPLAVAVFSPHPRRFFRPQTEPFRLMSDDMRARVLAEAGVEALFELPFTRDLSMKDDRGFARDVLADGLGARHVAVGFDFRFGRDRVGDAGRLVALGQELGFTVSVVEPVTGTTPGHPEEKCSSTAIRRALAEGDVPAAQAMLTRPWVIDGLVTRGDQRGRTIGFPTANVSLGELVRPKFGVYAVQVRIEAKGPWHDGVANIGRRPTFEGVDERLEAHLFDFDGDLYGRRLDVAVQAFLRPERKFDSLEALKAQIALDVDAAKHALNA